VLTVGIVVGTLLVGIEVGPKRMNDELKLPTCDESVIMSTDATRPACRALSSFESNLCRQWF